MVVVAGVTVQVEAVVPTQVPPVQVKEVTAGLQLAVRTVDLPGATLVGTGVRVQIGTLDATPLPVRLTCGLLAGLLPLIFSVAMRPPATVGLKLTLRVQDAFGAKVAPHPVTAKSFGLIVISLLEIVNVTAPVLVNTTV